MFSFESPHRGDSNEYIKYSYTIFNIKKENYPKSRGMGVSPRGSRTSSKQPW